MDLRASGTNEPRVDTARHAYVRGSFHNGAAVRKERQLVFFEREAQGELVYAHITQGAQAGGEFVQIQGPGVFV